jgi:hypothetical protein
MQDSTWEHKKGEKRKINLKKKQINRYRVRNRKTLSKNGINKGQKERNKQRKR